MTNQQEPAFDHDYREPERRLAALEDAFRELCAAITKTPEYGALRSVVETLSARLDASARKPGGRRGK